VSSLPIEGTISARPFTSTSGSISAPVGQLAGSISAPVGQLSGSISADPGESPENSAIAELGNLISSLGALSAQAQTLPLTPPTLPGAQQPPGYQTGATDYMQFASDAD
jgi:hypothetical protein